MGGGTGGLSTIDLSKLTKAAEDRLRQLGQSGTHVLFACEAEDKMSLESHLARSKVFDPKKYDVIESTKGQAYRPLVEKASVVIVFTNTARQTKFLDDVVEFALQKKKQGVHAKASDEARIPSKASAYRWPSLSWEKLEAMFA